MAILTMAQLTLREAGRRKLLLSVALLTLVLIPAIAWGFSFVPGLCANRHQAASQCRPVEAGLLILVAYMFSFIIAVAAPFIAAPALSGDIESHTILAVLARPMRRAEYVIGRWLGLAILLVAYTGGTCSLEFLGIDISVGYVVPHPLLATVCIMGEAMCLMTLALLASTRLAPITGGISTIILFGTAWIAGIAVQIGAALGQSAIADVGTVSSMLLPTDGFWRAALFNMEPVSMVAVLNATREASADPFGVAAPPSAAYIVWAIAWIGLVLAGAIWSFSRREV